MTYTVMVTASRGWTRRGRVEKVLRRIEEDQQGYDMRLVVGDASGGDQLAQWAGRRIGWRVDVFVADWERHKRKAGILRNLEMLDQNPDLVVAFWDGVSKGTAHAFNEALKRGIPTDIYVRSNR